MKGGPTPTFVLGTGRCGSTLLSELLRDFSAGLSLSELFTVLGGVGSLTPRELDGHAFWHLLTTFAEDLAFFLDISDPPAELLARRAPSGRPCRSPLEVIPLPHVSDSAEDAVDEVQRFVRRQPTLPLRDHFDGLFAWLQARHGKTYWVERSGGALEYVDALLAHWPDARFLHLHRNGVACALSMSRHPFFRVRVARVLGRDPTLPARDALAREVPLDRFGAYWSRVVLHGISRLQRLDPAKVLHISLEQLVRSPSEVLARVFSFLGDPSPAPEAAIRAKVERSAHRSALAPSARDLRELERTCEMGERALRALHADA
jgi:hypothetical protein